MPLTKRSKNTKRSRVKARGQASRQQACGEREGQSLSHRGTAKRRYKQNKLGEQRKRRKEDKAFDQSKPKAGNSQRKERRQFRRTALPVCGRRIARDVQPNSDSVFGGRGAVPSDRVSIVQGTRTRGRVGGEPPHKKRTASPKMQVRKVNKMHTKFAAHTLAIKRRNIAKIPDNSAV